MSYNTLATQAQDAALARRIDSSVQQEARQPGRVDDALAEHIRAGFLGVSQRFVWPVCTNTEAAYASALAGGVENPGGDESVIPDLAILAAVQGAWDDVAAGVVPEAPA